MLLRLAVPLCLAGAAAALTAEEKKPAEEPAAVSVTHTKDAIEFRHGKALSAVYSVAPANAKPYFWPVNSPTGTPVTRPWPMQKDAPGEKTDHVHQKSLWFC